MVGSLLTILGVVLLILFVLLIIAVVAVLVSNIRVQMHFVRREGADSLTVEMNALYGLYKYRYSLPHIDYKTMLEERWAEFQNKGGSPGVSLVDRGLKSIPVGGKQDQVQKTPGMMDRYRELKGKVREFPEWMRETLALIRCTELVWYTGIGAGEAPRTAMLTGVGWSLKTSILGFLFRYFTLDTKPEIAVVPQYNEYRFITESKAEMKVRVGSMAMAGLKLWFRIKDKQWAKEQIKSLRSRKSQPAAAG